MVVSFHLFIIAIFLLFFKAIIYFLALEDPSTLQHEVLYQHSTTQITLVRELVLGAVGTDSAAWVQGRACSP